MLNNKILKKIKATKQSTPVTESGCSIADGTPVDASNVCNTLAKAEGNGTYVQKNSRTSASGRYQFVTSTAVDVIKKIGAAKTDAEAKSLWYNCRQSSTPDCKKLQDKMCNNYSSQIISQLEAKDIEITAENVYLAWNQGAGGASIIINAMKNGTQVTNRDVLKNMAGQAWKFSPDGKTFYANMQNYLRKRGVISTKTPPENT